MGSPHWRTTSVSPLLVIYRDLHVRFGVYRAGRAAGRGRLTGGLPLPGHSLLFNEIYMFGLVCTGLGELLDGVASLEDYLRQSTLVI
jgi:hypothetical protein